MSSLEKWMAAASAVLVSGTLLTLAMPSVQAISPTPQLPTLKPAENLAVESNKAKVPHTISQVLIPATAPILADPPRLGGRIFRAAPKPVTEAEPLRVAQKRVAASEPVLRVAYKPLPEIETLRVAHKPLPALESLRSTSKPFSEQDSLFALRAAQKPLSEPELLRGAPKPVSGSEILRSAPRPFPQT
ncbi:MAG: hypothetical protein H7Y37_03920 [Anaerolineae bacterium]|nr:hypothetical protein [Gloeobacterales cyanobacterium ES-bin-313]